MMSEPPLECFENLNHLDKPELPQGISGGDTKSFRGRLSVSDVSPPRLFIDSRKDFSWRRSTPIHEAKCR